LNSFVEKYFKMLQLIINAVISAGLLALISWSFAIVFNTTKVFHLAHSVVYSIVIYLFIVSLSLTSQWGISIILAIIGAIAISLLMELLVYRPLFLRGVNQNITLIASLGLNMLGVNLIALVFGNNTLTISSFIDRSYIYGDIIITRVQVIQLSVASLMLALLHTFFSISRVGLKLKAVADKSTIASVLGINVLRIRSLAFIIGTGVLGVAAILYGIEIGVEPNSGMNVMLLAIAIVILSGKGGFVGIITVSFAISFILNLTEWFFTAQVKEAVTYFILIATLMLRTENIFDYKMRVEER
jgi:branched-chain amino acid transport system permease protein